MKQSFSEKVTAWGKIHGRKQLPWQREITPYRVWVSEIMLQQTQVETVIPYFERFLQKFPDVGALAAADLDEVLHLWSGLGYYARARNLHKSAQTIINDYQGIFPADTALLEQLPGVGRSTAGAIVSLSQNQFAVILDGNVKRVLARYFAVQGWPGSSSVQKKLWELAETLTPVKQTALYNQSMMDLGSLVCRRSKPACETCPVKLDCQANQKQAQHLYPGKKPKKLLPVRTMQMLAVMNDEGSLLLEQRPPVGIWGGLWGLPEKALAKSSGQSDLEQALDLEILDQLPVRRHSFSHFHLDIHPVVCRARSHGADWVNDRQTKWYDLDNPSELGLAAPVSLLVDELKAYLKENKGDTNS